MELVLTNENFNKEVIESELPVLVDFWATWCGPCKAMGPVIEELAEELEGSAKVGKVNVDDEGELAKKYRVMSIPTLMVFKNGKEVARKVGVTSKEELIELTK